MLAKNYYESCDVTDQDLKGSDEEDAGEIREEEIEEKTYSDNRNRTPSTIKPRQPNNYY